ncbi:MAG: hypothetical protein ABMA64_39405 [Myxococcota bacterium]
MTNRTMWLGVGVVWLAGCPETKTPTEVNEEEVITTVQLDFTPAAGGDTVSFVWADPENDGNPVVDPITLALDGQYAMAVSFLNELADPVEDITAEVNEESDQHQVFVLGSAVAGPATGTPAGAVVEHAYADTDPNGLPVGLVNDITVLGAGSGTFEVVLRHLPPDGDVAVKVDGLAEQVASGGFGSLPGATDVDVTFDLTVE